MRLLFDTNVILDVLLEREPFVNDARTLWTANDSATVDGYLTASVLTDIHYIARKIAESDMARQAFSFAWTPLNFVLLIEKRLNTQCFCKGRILKTMSKLPVQRSPVWRAL